MSRVPAFALFASFLAVACVTGCAKQPPPPEAVHTYDLLERHYAPHVDRGDPLGFPMKVKSLMTDEGTFWRGCKDVFYVWCANNASDWLDDPTSYVTSHGDLHLGNIGTYPSATGPFGTMAFGEVDFDESARLPYQIELLQGLVTLRLAARQNNVAMTGSRRRELAATLVEAYRAARAGEPSAAAVIASDREVQRLNRRAATAEYPETIEKYTQDGRFRALVGADEDVKEILRPVVGEEDAFAAALAQAVANAPATRDRLTFADAAGARAKIRGVVQRTRVGSSGSQGLRKYLILMDAPLREQEGPAFLYLKEQVPAAAERAGIISRDPRPAGRRLSEDTAALTDPDPMLNSWCEMEGRSYALLIREPWSEELSPKKLKRFEVLLRHARLWATVAGTAHRHAAGPDAPTFAAPTELASDLSARADVYFRQLASDYAEFHADPRAVRDAATATRAIDAAMKSATNR
jgi:uncharacterized protein (DUF2252 family)